jgi:transcription antitermination factor NusG
MKYRSSSTERSSSNIKKWYAVYVRSRHEKSVHEFFFRKGIESSLTLKSIYRQWSDRKKKVEVPLFRGYVFVNIDISKEKLSVLQMDGVVKFVTFCNKTVSIPEADQSSQIIDFCLDTTYHRLQKPLTVQTGTERAELWKK